MGDVTAGLAASEELDVEAARAVVAGAQRQLVVGGQLLHVFADLLDQLDVNLATDVQQACGKASAHILM